MTDNLNHSKVDEIRGAINDALEKLRERFTADHPDEFDEALKQVVESEFDLELPRSDQNGGGEDPGDPHGSGFNKGP